MGDSLLMSTEKKLRPAVFVKVEELDPQSQGINLKVKVLSADTVMNKKHPDGTKIRISETLVGDDTAKVLFSARNEQIDIAKPGNYIIIRNSKIKMFKGFMRLTVDKWGLIEEDPNPQTFEVTDETENLSLVEYELVRQ